MLCAYALVVVLAAASYWNTLPAEFAFDDNFALIHNGDVTDTSSPVLNLLRHDFWGQDIGSDTSHKSYRPLTILAYRWINKAWQSLPVVWKDKVSDWRKGFVTSLTFIEQPERKETRGLDPLPFHAANIVAHALASVLVTRLALYLFQKRAGQVPDPLLPSFAGLVQTGQVQQVTAAACNFETGGRWHNWWGTTGPAVLAGVAFALHPVHTEAVAGIVGHAELLCALLSIPAMLLYFSLADAGHALSHVQHWILMSGVVLLVWLAALSKEIGITVIGSMLLYDVLLVSLDGQPFSKHGIMDRSTSNNGSSGDISSSRRTSEGNCSDTAVHKDNAPKGNGKRNNSGKKASVSPSAPNHASREVSHSTTADITLCTLQQHPQWRRLLFQRKWLRIVLLAVAGVAYVKMRSFVAVDQLVRIYRKVENPIPFSSSALTRFLSTGHLHARYAVLLLWPQALSADWSYACIPLLEQYGDARNVLTIALYGYLLATSLAAAPWALLRVWWSGPDSLACALGPSLLPARWRLMVLAGLLVGPFFPASNILFYVGTFIGERLLYLPSVGYCMLLADVVSTAVLWIAGSNNDSSDAMLHVLVAAGVADDKQIQNCTKQQGSQLPSAKPAAHRLPDPSSSATIATSQHASADAVKSADSMDKVLQRLGLPLPAISQPPATPISAPTQLSAVRTRSTKQRRWRRCLGVALALLLLLPMLFFYAHRTYTRNWDWLSEENLFLAAQKVCPDSAKVQLNSGILERRRNDFPKALEHFRRARQIEPGFCEPSYWIGLTLVYSTGVQTDIGLAELEAAIRCKYVAADALKALNAIYQAMHQSQPHDGLPLLRWANILLLREVNHLREGCNVAEQAVLLYTAMPSRGIQHTVHQAINLCLTAAEREMQPPDVNQLKSVNVANGAAFEANRQRSQMHRWSTAAEEPVFRAVASPVVDPTAEGLNASHVYGCVAARAPVYRLMAAGVPKTHPASKLTLYRYLQYVQHHPHCRGPAGSQDGSSGSSSSSPIHTQIVHRYQSEDSDDAWLQLEWGAILQHTGRPSEAMRHYQAASYVLQQHYKELIDGKPGRVLALPAPAVQEGNDNLLIDDQYRAAMGRYTPDIDEQELAVPAVMLEDEVVALSAAADALERAEAVADAQHMCDFALHALHNRMLEARAVSATRGRSEIHQAENRVLEQLKALRRRLGQIGCKDAQVALFGNLEAQYCETARCK